MTVIRPKVIDVFTVSATYEDLSPHTVTTIQSSVTFSTPRKAVLIYNNGTADIFFSTTTGVSATANFRLPSSASISLVFPISTIYFITAAGTAELSIIGER